MRSRPRRARTATTRSSSITSDPTSTSACTSSRWCRTARTSTSPARSVVMVSRSTRISRPRSRGCFGHHGLPDAGDHPRGVPAEGRAVLARGRGRSVGRTGPPSAVHAAVARIGSGGRDRPRADGRHGVAGRNAQRVIARPAGGVGEPARQGDPDRCGILRRQATPARALTARRQRMHASRRRPRYPRGGSVGSGTIGRP